MRIGIDVGSTTLKCVVLDQGGNIVYKNYIRHFSKISEHLGEMIANIEMQFGSEAEICLSGSAGMGLADGCDIPFEQEVYATRRAAGRYACKATARR